MEDELELSFSDLFKALKKNLIWMIILPLLAAILTGAYVVNFTVDNYTAEVKLYTIFDYVDTTGTVRYDMSSSSSFASDFKELIKTPNVINEACRRLGWAEWPEEREIKIQAVSGTRILNISVTDVNPEVCMKAANVLATVFVEYIHNIMHNDSLSIAAEAVLPVEPSNGGRLMYVGLAFILVFVLVVGVVTVKEMLNTKVRSNSDFDIRMHTNVLSRVQGYKKEMDVFLKKRMATKSNILACMSDYTQESIKKLALNLQFASLGEPIRSLTITSTTPSEGKSSVSLMLACEMANRGKKVLIVDMDYRSPMIGRYLGKRMKKDIMDYFGGNATFAEVVTKTNTPNLYFMDNNHFMAVDTNSDSFDKLIEEAKRYFDLVIFDTPPLGMFVDAACLGAKTNGVVVIVADGMVERKDLEKVFAQLKQVNAKVLGIAYNFVQQKEKTYYNKYYRYGTQHKEERRLTRWDMTGDDQEEKNEEQEKK